MMSWTTVLWLAGGDLHDLDDRADQVASRADRPK
jgi:hypothetical protein